MTCSGMRPTKSRVDGINLTCEAGWCQITDECSLIKTGEAIAAALSGSLVWTGRSLSPYLPGCEGPD